jgi:hypothetical protein
MEDDILSKLPEWHKVLRDIYEGVENEQNKLGSARVSRDQAK